MMVVWVLIAIAAIIVTTVAAILSLVCTDCKRFGRVAIAVVAPGFSCHWWSGGPGALTIVMATVTSCYF